MNTMDKYAGDAGQARLREHVKKYDAGRLNQEAAHRRGITVLLPIGRFLDKEDLAPCLDPGQPGARAYNFRKAFMAYFLPQLPGGVLLSRAELELVGYDPGQIERSSEPYVVGVQGDMSSIPPWP